MTGDRRAPPRTHGVVWMAMRMCWQAGPGTATVVTLVILVQGAAVALSGALQQAVVDAAGRHAPVALVVAVAAGLTLVTAATATGNRIQGNLRGILRELVTYRLSTDVLTWTTGVTRLEVFDQPDFLDAVQRLRTRVGALVEVGWQVVQSVATIGGLVASLVLLIRVSPWLSVMIVLAVPPLLLGRRSQRHEYDAAKAVAPLERQEARLHTLVTDPERAAELRVSRNEVALDAVSLELWRRIRRLTWSGQVRAAVVSYLGWLMFAAGYLASIGFTGWLVAQQRASLGDLALVLALGQRLRGQVAAVVTTVTGAANATQVAGDYLQLRRQYELSQPRQPTASAPRCLTSGITLEQVSFTYPNQNRPAVDDVSVTLPAGRVVALLGENGAGKTTLVKLLLSQYAPDAGTITIDGTNLANLHPAEWAQQCSGLVQDFAKLQGPIREAVGAGALTSMTKAQIRSTIDAAHATSIIDELPHDLDTVLGLAYGGRSLSHGQWQRLALARGLTRLEPLLLVLDEPTSALDPQVEHELFDAFFVRARHAAVAHGAIALVVSHRLSTTAAADLVIVMEHGRIVETGNHHDLIEQNGQYAELFRMQSRAYQ